ncbi:flagellar filament capping protein FliD [Thalassotalea sp. PLHSN55]|uniref:flagellar filament capping protein FliD n=1 Tax=Thalassotalea sp. PLHSN55 TaxID=3435888 RepID=UPI003F85850F
MIDPATFAAQLVSAERSGLDYQLNLQSRLAQAKIDAYQAIDGKAQALSDVLDGLLDSSSLNATEPSFSQEGFVQVTSSAGAAEGDYTIEVDQLAQAHRVGLSFNDANWQAPTSGILDVGVNGTTMSLDLSTLPAGASLNDLRDAINGAADNPGVNAIILQTGSDVKLVLTSEETGAANTVSMNLMAGAGAAYDELTAAIGAQTELTTAQDAEFTFSGVDITSSSNAIDNIIGGLSIELSQVNSGNPTTLSIARDDESISDSLSSLVDGYNALHQQIKSSSFGENGERAILSGDGTARSLSSAMRSVFNQLPAGTYLGDLGLSFDRDGKLSLDKTELADSLNANSNILNEVLLGDNGIVASLANVIEPFSESKGFLANRIDSLNGQVDRVNDKVEQLDKRMENTYQRYLAQFTQMNQLQAQMEQTASLFMFPTS